MGDNTEKEDIEFIDVNLNEVDNEKALTEEDFLFGSSSDFMDADKRKENRKDMKRKIVKEIYSYVIIFASAVVIAFCINRFVLINAHVPTSSMEPTISVDEKLM